MYKGDYVQNKVDGEWVVGRLVSDPQKMRGLEDPVFFLVKLQDGSIERVNSKHLNRLSEQAILVGLSHYFAS